MRVHMSRKHLMANFACHVDECNFNAPFASGIVAHVDADHKASPQVRVSRILSFPGGNSIID